MRCFVALALSKTYGFRGLNSLNANHVLVLLVSKIGQLGGILDPGVPNNNIRDVFLKNGNFID